MAGGFLNPSTAGFISDMNSLVAGVDTKYNDIMNTRVGEPSVTSLLWGKVIPITYGTRKVLGQIIQLGERKQETNLEFATSGANLGGGVTYESAQTSKVNVNIKATFAVAFGAPGNPGSTQILKKLWLNKTLVYDVESAAISRALNFRFYEGSETQTFDETLNARFTFPLAYRGLIYMPVYDYSETFGNLNGAQNNPMIEAEITEQLNNNQDIVIFDELDGGTAPSSSAAGVLFDKRTGYLYTIRTGDEIYVYDTRAKRGVAVYPITPMPGGIGQTFVGKFMGFTRVAGVNYIIGQASSQNSRVVYLIEADTGVIVDSVGIDSGSLTQDATHISALIDLSADEYSTHTLLNASTVFGGFYRFRVEAESISVVSVIASGSFPDDVDLVNGGGGYAFIAVGATLDLINSGGTRVAGWYSMSKPIRNAMYSPSDDTVVLWASDDADFTDWEIRKVHMTTQETIWSRVSADSPPISIPSVLQTAAPWRNQSYTLDHRIVAWVDAGQIGILNTFAGTVDVYPQLNTYNGYGIYDAYSNRIIGLNVSDEVIDFPIVNASTTGYPLSALLVNLAERQGYATVDITVQNITDTIVGAAITEISDIAVMLNDLRIAYNFVIRRRGKKIVFSRRVLGASFEVDSTIIEAQRGIIAEDDDAFITVKSERIATKSVPGTINLWYIDPDQDYIQTLVTHVRNDDLSAASGQLDLRLPVIITASTAFTLAARITAEAAEAQMVHTFMLSQKYNYLEQGDYLELVFDDYSDVVRIEQIDYNGDKSITVKGVVVVFSAITPYELDDLPLQPSNATAIEDASAPLIFDTPLLTYHDESVADVLETYYGIVPAGRTSVSSGVIMKENDGAQEMWGLVTGALTFGRINALTLNEGVACAIDYLTTISFRLEQGDAALFVTEDKEDVLAGLNRVLVGNLGRWELIGYIEASYDAVTNYVTLSGLIRGLRGTDVNVARHISNDYVVYVGGSLGMAPAALDDLGETALYAVQGLSGGDFYEDGVRFTQEGASRKPWAPGAVHVVAAGSDVALTWARRTRLLGPLLDGTPAVPLDEDTEAYEVDIYRAGSIVRTVTGLSSPAFTYTAAMQSADGWSGAIVSLQLDIYQISALVGRGFSRSGVYDVS